MLRDVQSREPFPYGDILAVPLSQVTEFRQTSGTTGTPVYQADTWQDWEWWAECWAYILYAQGYRDTDRLFLPFGYNIFVAFWACHYGAEKLGCEVVPGGVLDTEARIMKMKELKCTAFGATPTYVLGMADTAQQDRHRPEKHRHKEDHLRRRAGREHPHDEAAHRGRLGSEGLRPYRRHRDRGVELHVHRAEGPPCQ